MKLPTFHFCSVLVFVLFQALLSHTGFCQHPEFASFMPFNVLEIQLANEIGEATDFTATFDPLGIYTVYPQNNFYYSPPDLILGTLVNNTVYWEGKDDSIYRISPGTPHPNKDSVNWDFSSTNTLQAFLEVGNNPGKVDNSKLYTRAYHPGDSSYSLQQSGTNLMQGITGVVNQTVVGTGGSMTSFIYGAEADNLFQFILDGRPNPLKSFVGFLPSKMGTTGKLIQLDTNHLGFLDSLGNIYSVSLNQDTMVDSKTLLNYDLLVSYTNYPSISMLAGGNGFLYFLAAKPNVADSLFLYSLDSEVSNSSPKIYPGMAFASNEVKSLLTDNSNNILLFGNHNIFSIVPSCGVGMELQGLSATAGDTAYSNIRRLPSSNLTIPIQTAARSYPRLHLQVKDASDLTATPNDFYIWASFNPLSPLKYSFWYSYSPFGYPDPVPGFQSISIPIENSDNLGIEDITGLRLQLNYNSTDGLTIGALIIDPDIVAPWD